VRMSFLQNTYLGLTGCLGRINVPIIQLSPTSLTYPFCHKVRHVEDQDLVAEDIQQGHHDDGDQALVAEYLQPGNKSPPVRHNKPSSQAPQVLVAEYLHPGNKSPLARHPLSTQHEDCPHNQPVPEHPHSLPVHSPPIPELDPVQSVSTVPERFGQEVSIAPERSSQAVSVVHERSGLAVSEIKPVTGKQDPGATPTVSELDSDKLEVQTDREEASETGLVFGPLTAPDVELDVPVIEQTVFYSHGGGYHQEAICGGSYG
jgi:hypothetical protein